MAFLKVQDLTYYYPEEVKPALKEINFSLQRGEFVLLVGGSGCGKSTLVRALAGLVPDFYGGKFAGRIFIEQREIRTWPRAALVEKIGLLFQDPENQLIMTTVEQELVFGLENIGLPEEVIERRLRETAIALSLTPYLQTKVQELSGGLKQKVVLASLLAMQPEILLLDEPTSQLDPVAAAEILTIVRKLNEDLGITVLLIEQSLEHCFHLADRVLVLEEGRLVQNQSELAVVISEAIKEERPFLPPLPRLFAQSGYRQIPLTVKEGRQLIASRSLQKKGASLPCEPLAVEKELFLQVKKAAYTYQNGQEALVDINLEVFAGDFWAVLGENAAGKTTLLKMLRGLLEPTKGTVCFQGTELKSKSLEKWATQIGYLSQEPGDYLFLPTVREEVQFTLDNLALATDWHPLLKKLGISQLAENYARDLSLGEKQRVALATVLIAQPRLILLDEPTRGLDYELKASLGEILLALQQAGCALVLVTHDLEFVAEYATKIALLSEGAFLAQGDKTELLANSLFWTPQVTKLFRNLAPQPIVTWQEGQTFLQKS